MAVKRAVAKPVTRSGWAAYYDLRAARTGAGSQACHLANFYLLLIAALGDD